MISSFTLLGIIPFLINKAHKYLEGNLDEVKFFSKRQKWKTVILGKIIISL